MNRRAFIGGLIATAGIFAPPGWWPERDGFWVVNPSYMTREALVRMMTIETVRWSTWDGDFVDETHKARSDAAATSGCGKGRCCR